MLFTGRHSLLMAFCLAKYISAFSLPSFATHNFILAGRDTLQCPIANSTQCGNGLPGNFCCQAGSYCTILAHNTTAICCPSGSDCSGITPINCNVQVQNVTAYPSTVIMTTNLTAILSGCGTGCCPLGYSCLSQGCHQNANQNNVGSVPSSTSTFSSMNTKSTSIATASSSSSTITTSTPLITLHTNRYPASAIIVGFFPGVVLGVLLTLLTICLIGARRAHKESQSPTSPFGKVAASISDPIYRRSPNSAIMRAHAIQKSSISNPRQQALPFTRVRSIFQLRSTPTAIELTTSPVPKQRVGVPGGPVHGTVGGGQGTTIPMNTTGSTQKQPSSGRDLEIQASTRGLGGNTPYNNSEEINIFADPRLNATPSSNTTSIKAGPASTRAQQRHSLSRLGQSRVSHDDSGINLGSPKWGAGSDEWKEIEIGRVNALEAMGGKGDEARRDTTFTDLMDRADLGDVRRGRGFVVEKGGGVGKDGVGEEGTCSVGIMPGGRGFV